MASIGIILPVEEKQNFSKKLLEEDNSDLLFSQQIEIEKKNKEIIEKQILSFLEKIKSKKNKQIRELITPGTKSKVGFLKEGYDKIYNINPIDRYNFLIDRYNEKNNRVDDIFLSRVPSCKIIRRLYDFYTWVSRLFLGAFMIISYYCYKCRNKIFHTSKSKVGMLVYKHYLFNENQDYYSLPRDSNASIDLDKPSFMLILYCSIFLIFSLYILAVFLMVMIIPNIIFTIYLSFALLIERLNKKRVKDFFANMLFDPKLDERNQLNDYIIVDSNSLKFYEGCSFYSCLVEKIVLDRPISLMTYGNLFKREFDILWKSWTKQVIGIISFLVLAFYLYYN
jgi:hypothetical protein